MWTDRRLSLEQKGWQPSPISFVPTIDSYAFNTSFIVLHWSPSSRKSPPTWSLRLTQRNHLTYFPNKNSNVHIQIVPNANNGKHSRFLNDAISHVEQRPGAQGKWSKTHSSTYKWSFVLYGIRNGWADSAITNYDVGRRDRVWQWKPFFPTSTRIRFYKSTRPFCHKPLRFATSLLNDASDGSRRSRAHLYRWSWSVTVKAADKLLLDTFLSSSKDVKDWLRTSSYHFVMPFLTEMTAAGGLDKMFDQNVKLWAQSSKSMDTFILRALTSSQIVHQSSSPLSGMLIIHLPELVIITISFFCWRQTPKTQAKIVDRVASHPWLRYELQETT